MSDERPKKIKIGYYTIAIKYCDDLDDLHGDFNSDNKTIRINSRYSREQQAETLLHEIMHAVIDDTFAFGDEETAMEKEEKAVRILSPKIMEVMTSNKKLRKYLFEKKVDKIEE